MNNVVGVGFDLDLKMSFGLKMSFTDSVSIERVKKLLFKKILELF